MIRVSIIRDEDTPVRINGGQTVQLNCTMVFGNETGVRNITYIWSRIVSTGDALPRVAVVEDTSTTRTVYQCRGKRNGS